MSELPRWDRLGMHTLPAYMPDLGPPRLSCQGIKHRGEGRQAHWQHGKQQAGKLAGSRHPLACRHAHTWQTGTYLVGRNIPGRQAHTWQAHTWQAGTYLAGRHAGKFLGSHADKQLGILPGSQEGSHTLSGRETLWLVARKAGEQAGNHTLAGWQAYWQAGRHTGMPAGK